MCSTVVAPSGRDERYRELGHELVPGAGDCSRRACDGIVRRRLLLLDELGTWPLADVLAFATGTRIEGYPVVPGITGRSTRIALREWPAAVSSVRRSSIRVSAPAPSRAPTIEPTVSATA